MPTELELPAEWPTLSLDRRVAWAAIALAFPIATHQLTSTSLGVRERDVVALIRPGGSATSFAQVHYSVFQPNPRRARRDRYRALAASLRRRMSEQSDYDARVGPVVAEEIAKDRVRFGEWQG